MFLLQGFKNVFTCFDSVLDSYRAAAAGACGRFLDLAERLAEAQSTKLKGVSELVPT